MGTSVCIGIDNMLSQRTFYMLILEYFYCAEVNRLGLIHGFHLINWFLHNSHILLCCTIDISMIVASMNKPITSAVITMIVNTLPVVFP